MIHLTRETTQKSQATALHPQLAKYIEYRMKYNQDMPQREAEQLMQKLSG